MRELSYPVSMDNGSYGNLIVRATSIAGNRPIANATVNIYYEDNQENQIESLTTDANGITEPIRLAAPPLEYSMQPTAQRPYSEYSIEISAAGFEKIYVNGSEILPNATSIQEISMQPQVEENTAETFVIPEHTLYGDYPPKIAENEIKDTNETGEIVLSRVVIPEYIIVHDGPPTDATAMNYYVKYKDYIKNVASSEIYATWPEASIIANVLAIMSFTLNRVYTEWYRNKGYNFTITTSTAFDQKWISGRNIFSNISSVVDNIFANYLSRPGVTQPIFTQYCDGNNVTCPGWMSQWGSKSLADNGYSAIEIIRNYYGSNMYINSAVQISGVPSSWIGYDLDEGASGDKVLQMQKQLNTIATAYPLIPKIVEDGIYGSRTKAAVTAFQNIFGLPANGITDFPTWYKISEIYVGVSKISEYA